VSEPARAACIIGWPVDHSRSPIIHNYWLKTYGIAGVYRREAVEPEHFGSFVQSLSARGYVGANVTIPHKEAVLDFTVPDDRASNVGAANTLWLDDDGFLRATNTDVEGFLDNLDACAPAWDRGLDHAVVLGAGGAARAIVYGLLTRDAARISVVNRTAHRAKALQARFGERVEVAAWEALNDLLGETSLLVNTTTLGMADRPALAADVGLLPSHATVADLVYVPLITPLLRAAQARGLRTADGLGMLLHQAVGGFTLWFGQKPEVTAQLRAAVEADLGAELGADLGPSAA
jgi:shikimate dehydrogenase